MQKLLFSHKHLCFLLVAALLFGCSDPRSERDKFSDRILVKTAKQMKKDRIYAAGIGGGCDKNKKINLLQISFQTDDILTIETARPLIVKSTSILLDAINSNPKSMDFFESVPISEKLVLISINTINDETTNEGNIFGACIMNGEIGYDIDNDFTDPEVIGPLKPIHTESFEEAKQIVESRQKGASAV